jgi:hypothetical protein
VLPVLRKVNVVKLGEHPLPLFRRLAAVAGIAVVAAGMAVASGGRAMAAANSPLHTAAMSVTTAPELGFVQTAHTASGTVEVHADTFSNGHQRALDAVSDFSTADAPNGTFQLLSTGNGAPELAFVKTAGTAAGTVEVHLDTLSNGHYRRNLDATTDFPLADAQLGTFQLWGSLGGRPLLGFMQTVGTGTGTVVVHVDFFGTGYHHWVDLASDFSTAGAPNGTFHAFGAVLPELAFIQTAGTGSGTVEVHVDSGSTRILDATSDFSPADAANGTFQYFGAANGQLELGSAQTVGTRTGTVEAHVDAISNNGQYQRILDSGSDFSLANVPNGTFQLWGLEP